MKGVLNSGNAVFRSARSGTSGHAADIAAAILRELAMEVPVVVRTAGDLAAIVRENPMADSAPDHSRLLVAFAPSAEALSALRAIEPLVSPTERLVVGEHAAYLHCPEGIQRSRAGAALVGRAGRSVTTRNWATTLKLHALASGSG